MNKLIKLTILIIMSLSVFFIYKVTKNNNIKILVIGDFLSKGKNNYNYLDNIESNYKNISINKNYIKEDLTIEKTYLILTKDSKLKKDLISSHILILNLGYNDYLINSTLKRNNIKNNNPLEEEQIELTRLLEEIRKYYKNNIIIIGYPNNNEIFIDKVNTILKEKEVIYINPNKIKYTNYKEFYTEISKELKKTLEKEGIIWYSSNANQITMTNICHGGRRDSMKKDIHPEIKDCTVTCACGETFTCKSTKSEINVEVCSKCHPFFTGKQNRASRAGRVDKFNKKYGFDKKETAE